MAELRCPKCGKSNPDLLDVCQFCQTPLKSDSVLHIGETPTKKDTGELEAILPDWLKDVRQQARASAQEEEAQAAAQPKVEKEEPPDLLAGLVSQAGSAGEDEIPDWLASINPAVSPKPAGPSAPAPAPESDFFAQFDQSKAEPASEPAPEDVPAALEHAAEPLPDSTEDDDLSKWFARASEQPEEIVEVGPEAGRPEEAAWARDFELPMPTRQEPAPKEQEDLGWLHNLEDASKQTGDLQAPKQDADWMANFEAPSTPSEPSGSQEDLSWLDNLGGIAESPQQAAAQPAAGEDLSWLDNLGAASTPQPVEAAPDQPISARPFVSEEDLSWLSDLGGVTGTSQPAEAAPASAPQEDLSWLSDLGAGSGAPSASPFTESPRQTAPLDGMGEAEPPDWLKSAMQEPSPPPAGDASLDWFATQDKPVEEQPAPPAPVSDISSAPGEPASLENQDVDSLFSVEMPDWLSRSEPVAGEPGLQEAALPPAGSDESLAPVDLPSWVQAMRPMEAVISETASEAEEEPEEKEGPLAGLRGVIPGAAIALSKKPKAVSLKLQASDEQQTSAALLEKILESEINPRSLITSSFIASQRMLRRILTVLFLGVLSVVISLQSQMMPVSALLPGEGESASRAVEGMPAGAKVLVVIDYEASLAGEMEAVSGPLLDQMTLLHNPQLSFVSTSPNGSALVERLLSNTRIAQLGVEYRNLGFLPGGSAGVLGFVEKPGVTIPASEVENFSNYDVVILMTDHAESGRTWVEQLSAQKQRNPELANQPLIVIASAQAGPLLQPYLSSGQVTGMVSGLAEAARYEYRNSSRPGIARSYWDAFGVGLMISIALIFVGSLWSLVTGIRARRAEAEQG
ncbi:MAG: hypothetical protein JW730_19950 [Anaerolineales bacterium]|nr:hypothetical protein [Anaerolineales bacterium]